MRTRTRNTKQGRLDRWAKLRDAVNRAARQIRTMERLLAEHGDEAAILEDGTDTTRTYGTQRLRGRHYFTVLFVDTLPAKEVASSRAARDSRRGAGPRLRDNNPMKVMEEVLAIKPDMVCFWDEAWYAFATFHPLARVSTAMFSRALPGVEDADAQSSSAERHRRQRGGDGRSRSRAHPRVRDAVDAQVALGVLRCRRRGRRSPRTPMHH